MRIIINTICFVFFVSVTSAKIANNGVNEVLIRTVRFIPPIKTVTGIEGNKTVVKVEETSVPRFGRSLRNWKVLSHEPLRLKRSQEREQKNCRYPKLTDDSDIFCKIYPSQIICNQTCMFGYTLPKGPTRILKCSFEDDRWKPVRKFESCKPFVDCTVSLGPGGKMLCRSHYMDHGPICEISCKHYEDKPAIAAKEYRCDIDGKWHPKLPFCASPGTDLNLVPRPED